MLLGGAINEVSKKVFFTPYPPLARMESGMMDYIKLSLSPCCHT